MTSLQFRRTHWLWVSTLINGMIKRLFVFQSRNCKLVIKMTDYIISPIHIHWQFIIFHFPILSNNPYTAYWDYFWSYSRDAYIYNASISIGNPNSRLYSNACLKTVKKLSPSSNIAFRFLPNPTTKFSYYDTWLQHLQTQQIGIRNIHPLLPLIQ